MLHFLLVPASIAAIHAADTVFGYQSGNTLLSLCESKAPANQTQCVGYLQGTMDQLSLDRLIGKGKICISDGTIGTQLRDVAVNYLHKHPETREQQAAILMTLAFGEAWPCG